MKRFIVVYRNAMFGFSAELVKAETKEKAKAKFLKEHQSKTDESIRIIIPERA